MLCDTCDKKTPSHFLGNCTKQGCNNTTTSFSFKLCDDCSEELDECAWCRGPLSGGNNNNPATQTGVRFVVVRDADKGRTFSGLAIGEEVHVELSEDRWSGKEWAVKSLPRGILSQYGSSTFIQDPTSLQYGTRKFVFDIHRTGSGDLEFHEVQRSWGWWGGGGTAPVQGGQTFKVTIKIK